MSRHGFSHQGSLAAATRGAKPSTARTILASLAILSYLATIPPAAWAFSAVGNSTQAPVGPSSANLDLTTAAVVSFVLLLLGLAAGILLLGRFLNPRMQS
jgi:hypothetical protein